MIFWAISYELFCGFRNHSHQVEEVNYLMTRLLAWHAAVAAKSLQLCLTLCNPTDGSPPGSPVPGILQARKLEWAAISFSNAWKWKVKVKLLSRARLLVTPWIAAHQAPPSMGFSRQEYWSRVPLPSPGDGDYSGQMKKQWTVWDYGCHMNMWPGNSSMSGF